jgi:MSHA biogenesis protein MshP
MKPRASLHGLQRGIAPERQRGIAPERQRGIALPAMVFAIVIVGLLLSAGMLMLSQSQHTQTLQLQAARAMAAAKSGGEWGLWMVSDPDGAQNLGATTLPPCFATQTLTLPAPLQDMSVQVSCTREPASGSVDEGGLKLASYRVLTVASNGNVANAGSINFVQRQFEARTTVCKNPGGTGPRYGC